MTAAPAPSPAEQAVIDRFGIFDFEERAAASCPRCGSHRWVSVSLDRGFSRHPQCVPCGRIR